MKLLESVLDLLFPPKCPFCGKILDHPGICPVCKSTLPWILEVETLWELPSGVRCAAPLWYEDLARKGLLRLKFHGVCAAAEPLGALIAQCAAEHFSGEFDTVTWVPVSSKRLRQRGYDQAELLARSACRLWHVKPERLLSKRTDTPAQSSLEDAAARRQNVRDIYQAQSAAGKRILLVDDICTTGSTLAECARTLMSAGAESVLCGAVARTPQEKVHSSVKE